MHLRIRSTLLLLLACSGCMSVFGQSYFRIIDQPESGYYQRIERFPNGDILIGEATEVGPPPIPLRGFWLVRMDACGEVVWQRDYHERSRNLTFDQIAIDEADNIYVYGNVFAGNSDEIYLLKLDGNGKVVDDRAFDGAINGNVTYSLDYRDGKLMTFGALSDAGNPERSHLMLLDTNLNLLHSREYAPFQAYGEGISLRNGASLMVNGNIIMRADSSGQLEWAQTMSGFPFYNATSIPLEVPGGSVHAVHYSGDTWFFMIDSTGVLQWQSDRFAAFYHLPEMELLPNGEILAAYHDADSMGNRPAYLRLSPSGVILSQHRLQTNAPISSGFAGVTLTDGRRINLYGNFNMTFNGNLWRNDFLLQVDLLDPDPSCFAFVPYSNTELNDFNLNLLLAPVTVANAPMTETDLYQFYDTTLVFNYTEICTFEPFYREVLHDTAMACAGEWIIELPGPGYAWEDGNPQPARVVTEAGAWRASWVQCEGTWSHLFQLEMPSCDCLEDIQNVMTPNQDGVNDELVLQSDCIFESLDVTVYDRWGHLVYTATQLPATWDGTLRGKPVPEGVYYLALHGLARSSGGEIKRVHAARPLTLLR